MGLHCATILCDSKFHTKIHMEIAQQSGQDTYKSRRNEEEAWAAQKLCTNAFDV